jgi:hypothetical protein
MTYVALRHRYNFVFHILYIDFIDHQCNNTFYLHDYKFFKLHGTGPEHCKNEIFVCKSIPAINLKRSPPFDHPNAL